MMAALSPGDFPSRQAAAEASVFFLISSSDISPADEHMNDLYPMTEQVSPHFSALRSIGFLRVYCASPVGETEFAVGASAPPGLLQHTPHPTPGNCQWHPSR